MWIDKSSLELKTLQFKFFNSKKGKKKRKNDLKIIKPKKNKTPKKLSQKMEISRGIKEGRVLTSNSTMRKCKAKNLIDSTFNSLRKDYPFYGRLATCVHWSEEIEFAKAWENIFIDIHEIRKILADPQYKILFAMVGIEIHEGPKEKKEEPVEVAEKKVHKKTKKQIEDDKQKEAKKLQTLLMEKSLKGYPHIHIAMFFLSDNGMQTDFFKITQKIIEKTSFKSGDDVRIDGNLGKRGKKSKIDDNESILNYVIKNANYFSINEVLEYTLMTNWNKYPAEVLALARTNNCFLVDNCPNDSVKEFFTQIKSIDGKQKGLIIFDIFEGNKISVSNDNTIKPYYSDFNNNAQAKPKSDKLDITISAVVNYMIQNDLKISNGLVYQKKKNTRRTWKYWGDLDSLVKSLYSRENRDILETIMDKKSKIIELGNSAMQDFLPVLKINWKYIEFVDFYLHIPSFTFVTVELPPEIACGISINSISMKDIYEFSKGDTKKLIPEHWLSIITNQAFGQNEKQLNEFCTDYYGLLLPLRHKGKAPILAGKADSGKTSLIYPILTLFPDEVQVRLTSGQFGLTGITHDKKIIVMDDEKEEVFDDNNMLLLLEGGKKKITVQKKHKDKEDVRPEASIIICMNEIPESWREVEQERKKNEKINYDISRGLLRMGTEEINDYIIKEKIAVRIKIWNFINSIKNPDPAFMAKLCNLEIAKVVIFTGMCYRKNFLRSPDAFVMFDNYDFAEPYHKSVEKIFSM